MAPPTNISPLRDLAGSRNRDPNREELYELMREYARTRNLDLRHRLTLLHAPLVLHVAARFGQHGSLTRDDIVQVGFLGLIKAIAALSCLEPLEQEVLRRRFFNGATQAETGAQMGVSQMQISRLERRALARLRALLT